MKIHYITFATSNWVQSKPRLMRQIDSIQKYNLFDTVKFLNEFDLGSDFYTRFGKYIIQDKHGFLYYVWQPYLDLQELSKLEDGDYLVYMDGGSSFTRDPEHDARAIKYAVDKLDKSPSNLFFSMSTMYSVKFRNIAKKKFIEKFKPDEFLMNRFPHYQAGFIVFKKNQQAIDFCKKWYEMMRDNYEEIVRLRVPRGEIFNDSSSQCYLQYLMYTLKVPCIKIDYFKRFATRIRK